MDTEDIQAKRFSNRVWLFNFLATYTTLSTSPAGEHQAETPDACLKESLSKELQDSLLE